MPLSPYLQVRPKTMIPDSLPQSPCQEQQSSQPPSLQRATTVVSPKSRGPGPALPSANSTLSPVQLPNGQASPSPPTSGAGVAYAIISASPSATCGSSVSTVTEAVKVQPLLFSSDSKVSHWSRPRILIGCLNAKPMVVD